jgi:hypothetical protein
MIVREDTTERKRENGSIGDGPTRETVGPPTRIHPEIPVSRG